MMMIDDAIDPRETLDVMLVRRVGLRIRCGCGHQDTLDPKMIALRVGRRGLGARVVDFCRRLRCAQCDGSDLVALEIGCPGFFPSMNHDGEPGRRRAFLAALDEWLGPAGRPAVSGVIGEGGEVRMAGSGSPPALSGEPISR